MTLYDEVNQVRLLTKLDVVTQTIEIIDETTGAKPHAFVNDYGDVAYTKLVAGTNQVHLHVSGIGATNLGIVVEDLTGFNNAGQFVGMVLNGDRTESIRYTLGVGLETFSEAKWTYAINDAGDFTGAALARKGKKQKAFLYADTAGFDYIGDGTAGDTGYGININGDVCGWLEWSAFLDTAEDGLLKVDDLVVGTSAELAIWSSAARTKADAMNDRDSTGFPQLCGTIDHSIQVGATTGEAFVLTPIPTN